MTNKIKSIATTAIVAALYATVTMSLSFISYGPVQFRLAEIMTLLPLLNKKYILGLTLGCFLSNVLGTLGIVDIIFGTIATLISVYLFYLTGKLMKDKKGRFIIASLWPTIVNAIIIGAELKIFFGFPLILSMIQVGFGQFVVITIIGVPLFKSINNKYGKYLKNMF